MAPLPSPIGLELGGPELAIGELIGEGAFGQVHAVNAKSSSSKNNKSRRQVVVGRSCCLLVVAPAAPICAIVA